MEYDEARQVVEQLTRDAGYEPVRVGTLEMAGPQEAMIRVIMAITKEMGPYFYRIAPPEHL